MAETIQSQIQTLIDETTELTRLFGSAIPGLNQRISVLEKFDINQHLDPDLLAIGSIEAEAGSIMMRGNTGWISKFLEVKDIPTPLVERIDNIEPQLVSLKSRVQSIENTPAQTIPNSLLEIASLIPTEENFIAGANGRWTTKSITSILTPLENRVAILEGSIGGGTLDPDLATIAGLTPSLGQFIVRGSSGWISRTLTSSDLPSNLVARVAALEAGGTGGTLDPDLLAIAGLTPSTGHLIVRGSSGWISRALTSSDLPDLTARVAALEAGGTGGTLDPDLLAIAGLTPSTGHLIVRGSSGWISRALTSSDLPDLTARVAALEAGGTGGSAWGSITGNLNSQADLNTALTNLSNRINNLAPASTGFFVGGDQATGDRKLGNLTRFDMNLITENVTRLTIHKSGAVNIWDGTGNRSVVPNEKMRPGSLTIGNIDRNFGHGINDASDNQAGLMLECLDQTEIAIHDAGSRKMSLFAYRENRLAIGRDMGWGKYERLLLNASKISNVTLDQNPGALLHIHGDGTPPENFTVQSPDRPAIALTGSYPNLNLIAMAANGIVGANLVFGTTRSSRRWNIGTPGDNPRFLDIASVDKGSDYTSFYGMRNYGSNTGFTIIAPGQSQNNAVGNTHAVGINQIEPQYNLEVNGTFAFGDNNTRSQIKNDAGGVTGLSDKQSGFFYTEAEANKISNFFSAANSGGYQYLIDCRLGINSAHAMQIAGRYDDQRFYGRKTVGAANTPWREFLMQTEDFISNGWTTNGNKSTNASQNFIGTIDNVDFVVKRQNVERIRFADKTTTINETFTVESDSRTFIKGRVILGERNNINLHNPYGDWVGAPTLYVDRMEVGATDKANGQPAILRLNQRDSGMCEFMKPHGATLFLRETPGGGGGWFNLFTVQARVNIDNNTQSTSTTTGAMLVSGGVGVAGSVYAGGIIQAAEFRVNGTKVVGERQPALTGANGLIVDTTYGQEEADVINNLRIRLNELESRLRNFGVLN